jgi:hypothetical protein
MAAARVSRAKSSRIVTAFFDGPMEAECAYQMAITRGYGKDDLSVLMSNDTRDECLSLVAVTKNTLIDAASGSGDKDRGGAIGATLGAFSALAANLGAFTIPGLNLIAVGPIAATILGASLGGFVGSLIWSLVEWGVPYRRARAYAQAIETGGIVLEICPRAEEDTEYLRE